jgi:hypothetical protein
MSAGNGKMKSIWYFVGLMLVVVGGLVLVAGILDVVSPPATPTVLGGFHPAIWWSMLMLVIGAVFLITNRDVHHDMHE